MPESSLDCHLESTPDVCGGRPRIAGRLSPFKTSQFGTIFGEAPTKSQPSTISLGDIYAALAYYHDHRATIDSLILNDNTLVESVRTATPSKLRKKLNGS